MNFEKSSRAFRVALFLVLIYVPFGIARGQSTGADLYKSKCAACHAPDGSGNTPAGKTLGVGDLRSPDTQKLSDAQLAEIIAKGKNKMPAYEKSLTPDQINGLVAFIRELAKKN